MTPNIEICVDNYESLKAAYIGGAKRIELCNSLKEGGLTPSYGFFKLAKKFELCVFPMIRPRGGDFCYSPEEIQIMSMDIQNLKNAGADGFVFGCLLPDGSIDICANKLLLEVAAPLPCTFHRAFDMTKNLEKCLEDVINLGFKRILTSGHSKTALDGVNEIKKLVELAQDRIIIMPGSGINPDNLADILSKTKAQEYHCSASTVRQSQMIYKNESINMGSESSEFTWKISDAKIIIQLIKISERF